MSGSENPRLKPTLAIFLIMGVGFLLRFYLCFYSSLPSLSTDSFFYLKQEQAILSGHYLNYFPNGYPFLIALLSEFSGSGTALNQALLILNIVLSTWLIFLVYQITLKLSESRFAAILAALIMAFYPNHLNFVRQVLTEIPSTFFLVLSYACFYSERKTLSGFFIGLAAVIRTTLIPLIGLIFAYSFVRTRKMPFYFGIAALIPMLAVCTYCYQKTGSFSMSDNNRDNFIVARQSLGADINFNVHPYDQKIKTTKDAVVFYLNGLKEDPGYFLKQRAASIWELWGFLAAGDLPGKLHRSLPSRLTLGLSNAFILIFGFAGLYFYRKKEEVIYLIFPFIVITLIHTLLFSTPRFSVPVEPFMIILSALGIDRMRTAKKRKRATLQAA